MNRKRMQEQKFEFSDGLRVIYKDRDKTRNILSILQGNTRIATIYIFKKEPCDPRIAKIHELIDELKEMCKDE